MPIRIFLLGAGGVGSECIRDLLHEQNVSHISVADSDEGKLAALSLECPDPRISYQVLDVRKRDDPPRAIAGHDVVLNCLYGGLFDFAIEAACRAKVDYADVYSHPTVQHTRMAKEAGIVALTNLGSAPGISTILGRKGCEYFDEPEEVHFSHINWRLIAPTEAALDFALDYAGTPDNPHTGYYLRGQFTPTPPFEGSRLVDFGEPIGTRNVYFMPHSQASTIVKMFPGLKLAAVRGTWRQQTMEELQLLRRNGLLDARKGGNGAEATSIREIVRNQIWATRGGEKSIDVAVHALHVEVIGTKGAKRRRMIYRVRHHARDYAPFSDWANPVRRPNLWLTGVAASIGAVMLARSSKEPKGVTTPEVFFEPSAYLTELSKRPGIILDEIIEDLDQEFAS